MIHTLVQILCVLILEYEHHWTITRFSILRTEHDDFDLLTFPFSVANLMNQELLNAVYYQVFLCTERSWVGFNRTQTRRSDCKTCTCLAADVTQLRRTSETTEVVTR
jgi:hypothetical protein